MRPAVERVSISFWDEVAHAAQGPNRLAAELAAQAVDVDLDRVAADLFVPTVQAVFQLCPRQHRARALQQRFQHREFVRRDADRHSVALNGVRDRIDAQFAVLNARITASCSAAQHRTDAGRYLVKIEWLEDVVVGPGVKNAY